MPVIVAVLLVAGWTGLAGFTAGVAVAKPVTEQKAAQVQPQEEKIPAEQAQVADAAASASDDE